MKRKIYILLALFFCASCANRGIGPQGGPKDTIPPVAIASDPEIGALNYKGQNIEITFNEYLQLDRLSENLLISPPQQQTPEVKARGKKVRVHFKDSLIDSTTYTIDFGAAICDYTEKNPAHGFSFYFATGPQIDTLSHAGQLFDAENLNPLSGILVGIHSDLSDTAFTSHPFTRVAKTDSAGRFLINNIHPGTYRLYALNDVSRDNRFTPSEELAFAADPILVSSPEDTAFSTLMLFREAREKLYLVRTLREEQHRVQVLFSATPDSMPSFRALTDSVRFHTLVSRGDTLTLWLLDSLSLSRDTILFEARYRTTDSLFRLQWTVDTLRAVYRAPRLTPKAQEAAERQRRNRSLSIKSNAHKAFELNDTLRLFSVTPLAQIRPEKMHLLHRVDTLRTPLPLALLPTDTFPMRLSLLADMKPGESYELSLDSGALTDIYGLSHKQQIFALTLKTPADYSTLRVSLVPFLPDARIQLLSEKDTPLRELPAAPSGAFFDYLPPATYYLRLYIDENHDGVWTPGEWGTKRQPEPVYYYPQKITTKSNWDFEEEWSYLAFPQTTSKPAELIKNSAKKKK